jgi:hypothetical protein
MLWLAQQMHVLHPHTLHLQQGPDWRLWFAHAERHVLLLQVQQEQPQQQQQYVLLTLLHVAAVGQSPQLKRPLRSAQTQAAP